MTHYICTKFHESVSQDFQVIVRTQILLSWKKWLPILTSVYAYIASNE